MTWLALGGPTLVLAIALLSACAIFSRVAIKEYRSQGRSTVTTRFASASEEFLFGRRFERQRK